MAEAIALGASVIAILQVADRVISLCKFYIETASDAPSDIRAILVETSTIKSMLENLQFLIKHDGALSTALERLSCPEGPIEGCRRTITEMERLFPSNVIQTPERSAPKFGKIKATIMALAWPLKEQKARKLLERLVQYKTTISMALTTGCLYELKEIKKKSNKIYDMLTDSQRHEIHEWLQGTDPSPIHHRACKQYEIGTGDWMLRTPEWAAWLERKQRCVWIHGIPGAGKTILASHLIESIKDHYETSDTGNCAFVYYYCYFGHNQDEAIPFLKWIISRLCRQRKSESVYLYRLYRNGAAPSLAELLRVLEESLEGFDTIYLVLDAIDESLPREDLLKVLRNLISDPRFQKIQLLATSRGYLEIETVMEQISVPVSMRNRFLEEDIRVYVRSQVQRNPNIKLWPAHLKEEVVDVLATRAEGMFRWAACQIEVLRRLKGEINIVRRALANLPKTLDETYERIFLQVPDEDRSFVHHVLQWIYYHNHLHIDNISCAILLQAVEHSTSKANVSALDNFHNVDSLRELCGCLITVMPEQVREGLRGPPVSTLCVCFAHYTVWEFLKSARICNSSAAFFAVMEGTTRIDLTRVVIEEVLDTRHNIWQEGDFTTTPDIIVALDNDFNTYCTGSSMVAINRLSPEISGHDDLVSLIFDLLDPSKPHYKNVAVTAGFLSDFTIYFNERDIFPHNWFWKVDWRRHLKSPVVALTNLLQLDESCELAKIFLRQIDVQEVLRTQLSARMSRSFDEESYTIEGSIIDIFANMAFRFSRACALLLEFGGSAFDPGRVLLFGICSHIHHLCRKSCLLPKLLELGATPNLPGYKVMPLQMAVAVWDFQGVKALLDAGADANGTGDSTGYEWHRDSFLGRFNHLHGDSPLRICRTSDCLGPKVRAPIQEPRLSGIEAILLKYGALDFNNTEARKQLLRRRESEIAAGDFT